MPDLIKQARAVMHLLLLGTLVLLLPLLSSEEDVVSVAWRVRPNSARFLSAVPSPLISEELHYKLDRRAVLQPLRPNYVVTLAELRSVPVSTILLLDEALPVLLPAAIDFLWERDHERLRQLVPPTIPRDVRLLRDSLSSYVLDSAVPLPLIETRDDVYSARVDRIAALSSSFLQSARAASSPEQLDAVFENYMTALTGVVPSPREWMQQLQGQYRLLVGTRWTPVDPRSRERVDARRARSLSSPHLRRWTPVLELLELLDTFDFEAIEKAFIRDYLLDVRAVPAEQALPLELAAFSELRRDLSLLRQRVVESRMPKDATIADLEEATRQRVRLPILGDTIVLDRAIHYVGVGLTLLLAYLLSTMLAMRAAVLGGDKLSNAWIFFHPNPLGLALGTLWVAAPLGVFLVARTRYVLGGPVGIVLPTLLGVLGLAAIVMGVTLRARFSESRRRPLNSL